MDSQVYQTNPEKIGFYDFSERKIVRALPEPSISLPYDERPERQEGKKYEIAVVRPSRPIQIRTPQSANLLKKSVFGNVQYQAYKQAQMLDDQEIWHFVDILA